MKLLNIVLVSLFIFTCQFVSSQQVSNTVNGNSVAATVYDEGRLFHKQPSVAAGYEFPAGGGNHLIFSAGFWFGGHNQNGDLKLAADLFGQGSEFYRGPFSTSND